jgi:predicted O-methyltransferase YrrM
VAVHQQRPLYGITVTTVDAGFLVQLYQQYGHELSALRRFEPQLGALGRAVHKEARRVLYMMVRHFAPEIVVEFSPKYGLSTLHMALALEVNGRGRVLSFELGWRRVRRAWDNVRASGLRHRVQLFFGDAREEVPRTLRRLRSAGVLDGLEFLSIDSDHGSAFAGWYTRALFPYVKRGGVVHVDDVLTDPRRPGEGLVLAPTGEEGVVRQVLLASADRYAWVSLADCVRDPAYVAAVRPLGGGDVALDPDEAALPIHASIGYQWNPSLWILKTGAQESLDVVDVPFEPVSRGTLRRFAHGWRRVRFAALKMAAAQHVH